jgi:hypothetical protein
MTTRVVIVDDTYDEVKPLFKILNKRGIGFTYYRGTNHSEFPNSPLKGVRLMFLDFVLGTDGQPSKNKISTLIGVVKKLISKDNGPYIILAWTKHDMPGDDLLGLFKEEILKDDQFPKPIVIINMKKRDCMLSLRKINKRLDNEFKDESVLKILFEWENYAKTALCDVLRILSDISMPSNVSGQSFDDYSLNWDSELEKHIFKIAETSLGKNIAKDKNLIIAAQLALTNPFHDCIETHIKKNTKHSKKLAEKIISHKKDHYNIDERATMNTSFLLVTSDLFKEVQPGNIYRFNHLSEKMKCEKKDCYYNKVRLTKQKIAQEFFGGTLSSYSKKSELIMGIIPVLIEITPECDYVQKKWKNTKLILGILWPKDFEGVLSANNENYKPDYVYKPLPVKYLDEIYYLTFNAHHIFNISFHVFKTMEPILKARRELLVDIQQWFAKHISRPGKTEF